jgi:hypothetical protein
MTLYGVISRYHFTTDLGEHIASIFKVKVSQLSKQGANGRKHGSRQIATSHEQQLCQERRQDE